VNPGTRVDPCGSEPVVLTAASGTIESPGFDMHSYPNGASCGWRITAPPGSVRVLSVVGTHTIIGTKLLLTCN